MVKDLIRAILFFIKLRKSDACYIVYQKQRDGTYIVTEDGELHLNRKL